MTKIDFYQIESDEPALQFTCRLIDKIFHLGHKIHIHTENVEQSQKLDSLLWAFREDRFIPHAHCANEAEYADDGLAVKISHQAEPGHQDILVNLSGVVPDFFSRFSRVAEVVPLDDTKRDAARINYKFYKDRGYPLAYHAMKSK
tara:strand:- start:41 stop:475 length:435 start_codon:yes stop_codon:yes gene_type:complete